MRQDATPDATAYVIFRRGEATIGAMWLQMSADEWREVTGVLPSPLAWYRETFGPWVIEWRWIQPS